MQILDDEGIQDDEDSKMTVLTVLPEHETMLARIGDDAIEVIGGEDTNATSVTNIESTSDDSLCNTLNLSLRTSALSVQLQTRTAVSPLMAELTTKLECALNRVNETDDRLTNAIYRIGYLESQLAEKDRLIAELQQNK
ncbi:MAG: hypothetical protein P4L53_24805 [Candidatus Obscuribacterales bacterium]|nr:hypothetical protein [Candidatus Obscuribacterales bacterium]